MKKLIGVLVAIAALVIVPVAFAATNAVTVEKGIYVSLTQGAQGIVVPGTVCAVVGVGLAKSTTPNDDPSAGPTATIQDVVLTLSCPAIPLDGSADAHVFVEVPVEAVTAAK